MRRVIPLAVATLVVGGAAFGLLAQRTNEQSSEGAGSAVAGMSVAGTSAAAAEPGSALARFQRSIRMKPGTMDDLAVFELWNGRVLRLHIAQTEDGRACLIGEGPELGATAGCEEGGLFRQRRVGFFVGSDGGPERFSELHVAGVAAPEIGSVVLVRTDGSPVELALGDDRAFLYESTAVDLEHGVLPSALRLYGRSGRLAETVPIPALR